MPSGDEVPSSRYDDDAISTSNGSPHHHPPGSTSNSRTFTSNDRADPDHTGAHMPLSKAMARFNRSGLNRVTRRIAPRLPGFGVVIHHGRRSGKCYQTPVNVFTTSTGFRIALTYGVDSDWVKNVLAAKKCTVRTRGHDIEVTDPRIAIDPSAADIRPLERWLLRMMRVTNFLDLTRT